MQAHRLEDVLMGDMGKIIQEHEGRVIRIELSVESINQTLLRLEKRIDSIDSKMDVAFKSLNERLWNNFYWMIGGFTSILGILAKVLKWI